MDEFSLAQAGDPGALSALIRLHSPLVQALSSRFRADREDVFQRGCIGLVKAIRGFDPKRGNLFSTYAVPVILGEMRRENQNAQMGWRRRKKLNLIRSYQEKRIRQTGQMPAIGELAAIAEMEPAELVLLLEINQEPIHDETGLLWAQMPDPQGDQWLIRFFIRDILERMAKDEKWLLVQRYCMDKTQNEISGFLHLDQSNVSRKEKKARLHFIHAWTGEE